VQGGNNEPCRKTHEHRPTRFIEFTEKVSGGHLHLYGVSEKSVKRVDDDHQTTEDTRQYRKTGEQMAAVGQ